MRAIVHAISQLCITYDAQDAQLPAGAFPIGTCVGKLGERPISPHSKWGSPLHVHCPIGYISRSGTLWLLGHCSGDTLNKACWLVYHHGRRTGLSLTHNDTMIVLASDDLISHCGKAEGVVDLTLSGQHLLGPTMDSKGIGPYLDCYAHPTSFTRLGLCPS